MGLIKGLIKEFINNYFFLQAVNITKNRSISTFIILFIFPLATY